MRMLDGVFECRNDFFEIGGHVAATLDDWPQRDRRRRDGACTQRYRVEIVVEVCPLPAMPRIA
jgi:hypothetical protein